MSEAWDDVAVEALTKYWDEGFSASLIADALGAGFSRCAVIGKARRLGLTPRVAGINPLRREMKMSGKKGTFERLPSRPKKQYEKKVATIVASRPHLQVQFITPPAEMTKSQLRAELAQAVRNTAAMPVE